MNGQRSVIVGQSRQASYLMIEMSVPDFSIMVVTQHLLSAADNMWLRTDFSIIYLMKIFICFKASAQLDCDSNEVQYVQMEQA